MGRGSKVWAKRNTRKRIRPRENDSDESDEEYKVGEDEECDESDEYCSLDGDESEDSLADFEEEEEEEENKVKRVTRSRKAQKGLPGRKVNRISKPRKKRRASYAQADDDDYEEEDEDDEEFMLDDSDFVDDEDEKPKMNRNEKISRHPLQKKSFDKGQRKSRKSKVFKRPTRQKPRNRRLRTSKTSSANGMPVRNKNLVVAGKIKNISGRRKRRLMADSDSDFVSPGSSDYEYTISEEEREQLREAGIFCANLKSNLRSSSAGNRWQEKETVCQHRKHPGRKGKEKVEEMKNEVGTQVCGICLSEEGKRTVRGSLNCCSHYFCFSCIMEWSKVESRCPLCKQRFTTISKAARSNTGFDLRTVVIQVPERDQVYQPSEEELRGYLDPYESVICTECHQGGDDALMLLCDICDSPAHTFCVGLGREVPEGNWYCEGCQPTAFGSLNSQGLTPMSDRRVNSNVHDLSSPVTLGLDLNEAYVPETPLTQETGGIPYRHTVGDLHAVSPPSGSGAVTTLRDRRILHQRILHLNRMSRSSGSSNETPASSSVLRLFGAQLDQGTDLTPQPTINQQWEGRLEDNTMHPFSVGAGQFRGQGQNSTSISVDGSLQGELGGSAVGFNPRLDYGQLHHFTSRRSSIGPDANPSPYACREAIGPSRTSRGGLHTPY